jgi:hypothetical protein
MEGHRRGNAGGNGGRVQSYRGVAVAWALVAALIVLPGAAATSSSVEVSPGRNARVSWRFAPVIGAGQGGTGMEQVCLRPQCATFDLRVKLPGTDASFYRAHRATLKIHYAWDAPVDTDLDVFAFSPTGGESGPGSPDIHATGSNYEDLILNDPPSGVWTINSFAFQSPTPVAAVATAVLSVAAWAPIPAVAAPERGGLPRFTSFDFPIGFQTRDLQQEPNAGEPSIGVDPVTNAIMYMARSQITRITFKGDRPAYKDVTPPVLSLPNEDQILVVDATTHRTFAEGWYVGGSAFEYSDDDGNSWQPSTGSSPFVNNDHPTIGTGPFHMPVPHGTTYPHAVYLCAQNPDTGAPPANAFSGDAACALSTDGGRTFGAGQYVWLGRCLPEDGHLRVGLKGTVFIPNPKCTGATGAAHTGVGVSTDNGKTWAVRTIPDSGPGFADPSVAQASDGTVYLGYQDVSGHPKIAVSHNEGKSWSASIDVGRFHDPYGTQDGLPNGIQNSEFPEVITGSAGRAAFAFLGTGTPGPYQDPGFKGVWYLFVSYTYDGGRTWHTVNATPRDPVQRGCIWHLGGFNDCRNMLEFNDIALDREGHVLVAYTDGCTGSCVSSSSIQTSGCQPNGVPYGASFISTATCTYGRLSAFVRQTCGPPLLAADDRASPPC